jgi:hypothetical protein
MDFVTPCPRCSPPVVALFAKELDRGVQTCPMCGKTRPRTSKRQRFEARCEDCARRAFNEYLRQWRRRKKNGTGSEG